MSTTSSHDRRDRIDHDRGTKRRQDPVSCRLCRAKKLKCNRSSPCSNCIARNASCEYDSSTHIVASRIQQDAEPSNAELMSRLQKLEDMIKNIAQRTPSTPDTIHSHNNDHTSSISQTATPAGEDAQRKASVELRGLNTRGPSVIRNISDAVLFEIVSCEDMVSTEKAIFERHSHQFGQRIILMPRYEEAQEMFANYASHFAGFHVYIHVQSSKQILENVYTSLSRREKVDIDHAALLLGIFGIVRICTQMFAFQKAGIDMTANKDKIDEVFLLFFRAALGLLDHSRRTLPPTMEMVQTCLALIFSDCSIEGFTSRPRSILSQAMAMAKELGMYKLDSPTELRRREMNPPTLQDLIDLEIQRRIWWHVTATDWMLSGIGGLHEGTYSVNHQHIKTRLPRNINDDVLNSGNMTGGAAMDEPTSMTYLLLRVRLAEMYRIACDMLHSPDPGNYQRTLTLDQRILDFLNELPDFLKYPDAVEDNRLQSAKYAYSEIHRQIIHVGAQGLRCRIHQPFMARKGGNIVYKASEDLGVEAAMQLLKVSKSTGSGTGKNSLKLSGLSDFVLLATVVTVKDLCLNKADPTELATSPELATAIQMLSEIKDQSPLCQKFLDTMIDALKHYQTRVKHENYQSQAQTSTTHWRPNFGSPSSVALLHETEPLQKTNSQSLPHPSWQRALDQNIYSDIPDFDQLFAQLDTYITQ